jgi:hypothetical protein
MLVTLQDNGVLRVYENVADAVRDVEALAVGCVSVCPLPCAHCSTRLAARRETPAAFGRRCIPPGCVAPRSNIPDILARRALPAGRITGLGATPDFHHGLLGETQDFANRCGQAAPPGFSFTETFLSSSRVNPTPSSLI